MKNEEKVKKLLNKRSKDHKKHIGLRYPTDTDNGELYNYSIKRYKKIQCDELSPVAAQTVFKDLASWYLDNTQYQILTNKDKKSDASYFINASAYAYFSVYISYINFHCEKTRGLKHFLMDTTGDYMARCLLCGWEDEYKDIGNWMIESINFGYGKDEDGNKTYQIISIGLDEILVGWFLLDLYCLVYDRAYDKKNADYPDSLFPYQDVLNNWNTADMTEVDKLVYVMADYHLGQTQEEKNDDEYFSFSGSSLWLFPFEILTWLKLRENNGLDNPEKYSHPLMNTPIADFFLNLSSPLEKPNDLPYSKELLTKFKTKLCSDTVIPEWLS